MGMYDSIWMPVKCPKCGVTETRECQTKDLDRTLEKWIIGDYASDRYEILDCISDCDHCGSFFTLDAHLSNGVITGQYTLKEITTFKHL